MPTPTSQGGQSFMEKESALLRRLKETDYAMFDGNKDEALDTVGSSLMSMPDYVNTVVRMQVMQPIWAQRCEQDEYMDNVQRIDRQRKHAHDAVIANVNILNRMSAGLGLQPFADVDTADRHAVADLAGRYVNEIYNGGIGGGIDAAVKDKIHDYPRQKAYDRAADLDRMLSSRGLDQGCQDGGPQYGE